MEKDKTKRKKGYLIFGVGVLSFFVLNSFTSAMGMNLSDSLVQLLERLLG